MPLSAVATVLSAFDYDTPGRGAGPLELVPDASGDVGVKRIYQVWNRGYKRALFAADGVHDALHYAAKYGHLRRAQIYRRFRDVTDELLEGDTSGAIQRILDLNRAGCLEIKDGTWFFQGDGDEESEAI